MLSFIRFAMVMVFLHSNRTVTKTHFKIKISPLQRKGIISKSRPRQLLMQTTTRCRSSNLVSFWVEHLLSSRELWLSSKIYFNTCQITGKAEEPGRASNTFLCCSLMQAFCLGGKICACTYMHTCTHTDKPLFIILDLTLKFNCRLKAGLMMM